jgi:precorrin-2 dehydrogenase/sirohydrochlorin ferrochelatase
MAYFPIFVDLENKNVLVVGAGEVALRKIEKLMPFNPEITVVAKEVKRQEIFDLYKEKKIKLFERDFKKEDIQNKDIVIVAVDDLDLQKEIFQLCTEKNIPVNSVDSLDYCSFIFPAYIKKGDIVIGISTSGKAPALSSALKEIINSALPENVEEIKEILEEIRKKYPKGKERQKIIIEKLKELLNI